MIGGKHRSRNRETDLNRREREDREQEYTFSQPLSVVIFLGLTTSADPFTDPFERQS